MDELEWLRENAKLTPAQRDAAVDDLIGLVGAVDGILQVQSTADADYFLLAAGRSFAGSDAEAVARHLPARVPVAVHRLRRAGRPLQRGPGLDDHASAGRAHRRGAGASAGLTAIHRRRPRGRRRAAGNFPGLPDGHIARGTAGNARSGTAR